MQKLAPCVRTRYRWQLGLLIPCRPRALIRGERQRGGGRQFLLPLPLAARPFDFLARSA